MKLTTILGLVAIIAALSIVVTMTMIVNNEIAYASNYGSARSTTDKLIGGITVGTSEMTAIPNNPPFQTFSNIEKGGTILLTQPIPRNPPFQ